MKLILIRHAAAEERDAERWPDDRLRPLTDRGRSRLLALLETVGDRLASIDAMLTSDFVRARQTAELVHAHLARRALIEPERTPIRERALEAADARRIVEAVASHPTARAERRVALVGHEPDLSALATLLVVGRDHPPAFRMRKGSILALRLPAGIAIGTAVVDWMAHPRLVAARD